MATVELVENPRRRRGRRHLTAKQRAAGFGGKGAMHNRRRHSRRRNPGYLASLGNPRRRHYRKSRRRGFSVSHVVHRNPGLLGFDLEAAMWVGVGALGSKALPKLVAKYWPSIPTTGIAGYAVRAGATLAVAYAAKMAFKSQKAFSLILAGGLGYIFVDLATDYLLPAVGLAGLGNDRSMISTSDLVDAYSPGFAGYVDNTTMSGYVDTGYNPAVGM